MHFLGSKFTQNALAAGALPQIPLGELKCPPDPLPISGGHEGERERRGKREEGKWKGVLGKGKRKGRGEGRRREREGSLRHWRYGG